MAYVQFDPLKQLQLISCFELNFTLKKETHLLFYSHGC